MGRICVRAFHRREGLRTRSGPHPNSLPSADLRFREWRGSAEGYAEEGPDDLRERAVRLAFESGRRIRKPQPISASTARR